MAFMHDTDTGKGRWKKDQWRNFELWEKKEVREKRKHLYWIGSSLLVALLISIVPVLIEFQPRWEARVITRKLADEISQIKKDAAIDHTAYRLTFLGNGSLAYKVEQLRDCQSQHGALVREEILSPSGDFRLLTPEQGRHSRFSVPGLSESFCFDSILGNDPRLVLDDVPIGFAIIPVRDLTENRLDRTAILLISGRSANISFN